MAFNAVMEDHTRYPIFKRIQGRGKRKTAALREAAKTFSAMDGPRKSELEKRVIYRERKLKERVNETEKMERMGEKICRRREVRRDVRKKERERKRETVRERKMEPRY